MTLLNQIPFTPSWCCLVLLLPCFFLWVKHCTYSCLLFLVRVGQSSHPVNNSLDPNSVIPHFCHLYPFWLRVIYTFDEQALYISSWGTEFKNKCLTGQGQGQNPWACKYKSLSIQALSHSSALIQQGICLLNCFCIQSKFLHHVYKTLKTLFLRHKTKVQKPLSSFFSCQRKRLYFPYAKLITFSRILWFCFLSFVFSISLFFFHPTSISTGHISSAGDSFFTLLFSHLENCIFHIFSFLLFLFSPLFSAWPIPYLGFHLESRGIQAGIPPICCYATLRLKCTQTWQSGDEGFPCIFERSSHNSSEKLVPLFLLYLYIAILSTEPSASSFKIL